LTETETDEAIEGGTDGYREPEQISIPLIIE